MNRNFVMMNSSRHAYHSARPPTAEEEEELFQIRQAASAFAPCTANASVPIVRPAQTSLPLAPNPSLHMHPNPLQLKLAAANAGALMAPTAMGNHPMIGRRSSDSIAHSVLMAASASSSSLAAKAVTEPLSTSSLSLLGGGKKKGKSAVKRRSSGALKMDPFTLVRHTSKNGMNAAALGGSKSISPTGSGSKLTHSISNCKHRYSDSYLSGGLHGRSKGAVRLIAGESNATWGQGGVSLSASATPAATKQSVSPLQFLGSLLEAQGRDATVRASLSATDFFLENTEENTSSYTQDVVSAVRSRDIPVLRRLRNEGRTLRCCNRFGESLIHMACRRGFLDVARYLLSDEGGVSLRVRDDYGRTPLHDACWAAEPNFELMDMLLDSCRGEADERLLLMSDKRGHTPLDYARREHWGKWTEFLGRRFDKKGSVDSAEAPTAGLDQ